MKLEALRQPWTLRVCSYKQITFTEDVFFSVQCQLDGRSDFPWRKSGAQLPSPFFWWALMLLRQESTAPCWGRDIHIRISLSIFLTYQGVDGI